MKNGILKKILSLGLCLTLASSSFAFAAEETEERNTSNEVVTEFEIPEEKPAPPLRYDPDAAYPVYSGYVPDYSHLYSYDYEAFMEIFQLYLDTHLYEFDKEMLTEAFIMKLIQDNPFFMEMFINTLLGTMDEYSGYFESGVGLADDGSVEGYGISFSDEKNTEISFMGITKPGVYIIDVAKDSPAQKAGILKGDRIVSVCGVPTEGLTYDAVSYLMKYLPYVKKPEANEETGELYIPDEPEYITPNPENPDYKQYYMVLEVERNGEIITIKLLKDRFIPSNIVYSRAADKSYSYIKISSFMVDSDIDDFKAAIERAKNESNGNLLLDLRKNTGGRVDIAVAMANMLIAEEGRILFYWNSRKHEQPEPVYSDGTGYAFEKITILTNEYTASASELLCSILRYNCGATLVGTKTYGKAVGQYGYEMMNGDMFSITGVETLDPLKRSYNKIGLIPDIEIKNCMTKTEHPQDIGEFTIESVAQLSMGAENEAVLALEKRLSIFGFMREDYADGKYDSVTESALKSFNLYYFDAPTAELDEEDVNVIIQRTEKSKNDFAYADSQYDVAVMTFRSRSQAKRRVKELVNEEKKVLKLYDEYVKAEEERIKAEEAAKLEAEAMQNGEGEKAEGEEQVSGDAPESAPANSGETEASETQAYDNAQVTPDDGSVG